MTKGTVEGDATLVGGEAVGGVVRSRRRSQVGGGLVVEMGEWVCASVDGEMGERREEAARRLWVRVGCVERT